MSFDSFGTGNNSSGNRRPVAYALDSVDPSQTLANTITNEIKQLASNVTQIEQLSKNIGTSKDNIQLRENLRTLIANTRELAKSTTDNVKIYDSTERGGGSDKRILQQKLTKDLQTWLKKFQEVYKFCTEKESKTPLAEKPIKKESLPSTFPVNNNDNNFYTSKMDVENQTILEQERTYQMKNEQEFQNALIAEREKGIKDIEKSVLEVNEIFRDLSNIVVEQGVMIDSIESNIEVSVQATDKGVEELTKASDYQKSSRTKMCCFLLIILIVVAVAIGLVWIFLIQKKKKKINIGTFF